MHTFRKPPCDGGKIFRHLLKPQVELIAHRHDLCHQLHDTTGLFDLSLGFLAEPSRLHNDRDFGDSALAENFGVAEGQKVEDGRSIGFLAGDVGFAGLFRDQGPELQCKVRP
jgi:hypothetical protein